MSAFILSVYDRYRHAGARPRAEERLRRTADPVAARRPAPARLRAEQTHPLAIRRAAHLSHRLALSAALPPRRARVDQGRLGGEAQRAPAALLQGNGRGTTRARAATA